MNTRRCSFVLPRLVIAAVLQAPILYWTYELEIGGRYLHQPNWLFIKSGVAAAAMIVISPVLVRGDAVQKLLAAVLIPLPLMHFPTAVSVIIEKWRWAYA